MVISDPGKDIEAGQDGKLDVEQDDIRRGVEGAITERRFILQVMNGLLSINAPKNMNSDAG